MQPAPENYLIGHTIDGRYQISAKIASGGMATVYRGIDLRLAREVAIKAMHDHLYDDPKFIERFIQEARAAAKLSHPNVVNVFDQGRENRLAYMIMEYVPGITLRNLLRERTQLTPLQTLRVLIAILSGLDAAHRAGLIHRDIKPENILLGNSGQIKISDFGLTRAATNNTSTGQGLLGTIAYLSPELITRSEADARSDIYAIGIMSFEMLTGRQPFTGVQPVQIAHQHANSPMPRPSEINPVIPPEFDDIVLWTTAKDPEERPVNAHALLVQVQELEKFILSGQNSSSRPTPIPNQTQATLVLPSPPDQGPPPTSSVTTLKNRRKKKRGWVVGIVVVVIILAGGAGVGGWYFSAGPGSTVAIGDLSDLDFSGAKASLERLGLRVVEEKKYDLAVPAGRLISPPPSGQTVSRNGSITLTVSLGPQSVTLPKLVNLSWPDAQVIFSANELKVARRQEIFSANYPKNVVISVKTQNDKDISAGGPVLQGSQIEVATSLGPLPNTQGLTQDQALTALKLAQLNEGVISEAFSDTVPLGEVIEQNPQSTPVGPGGYINLVVSKGPDLVEIPNIRGKTVAEAIDALTKLGFSVTADQITNLNETSSRITTNPAAGTRVKRGSKITLRIP